MSEVTVMLRMDEADAVRLTRHTRVSLRVLNAWADASIDATVTHVGSLPDPEHVEATAEALEQMGRRCGIREPHRRHAMEFDASHGPSIPWECVGIPEPEHAP